MLTTVPFFKPSIDQDEIDEVIETLRSGWLTTGKKTKQFEANFAAYLQQRHAVAVNSCTAALHLALEAVGVKEGDGVLVPTMTFAASAEVVRYLNARPVLADCHLADWTLDPADAEARIAAAEKAGTRITAIIPVHYGGQIGDAEGIRRLATRRNLKIVEDAAHCCPAYFRDTTTPLHPRADRTVSFADLAASSWKPVGAEADITCFSFYANKTITTGEGGMACTNNENYADRMRIMSLHGISKDAWKRYTGEGSWYYEILAPGFKYNLTDIAAAIGIHQLRKADQFHRRRSHIAAEYQQRLGDLEEIILPRQLPDRIHSWHLFVIRLRLDALSIDRAEFIAELRKRGVATSVHWMPLHMHPYYRETYGYKSEDFPVAASVYPQLVSLPIYPAMTDEQIAYVCDMVREVVAANRKVTAPAGSPVEPAVSP
jgi:dTDP-4-amino-4,6-dideoxygalactose transaminase